MLALTPADGERIARELYLAHAVLPRHAEGLAVLLTGSVAAGLADEHSDVDVYCLYDDSIAEVLARECREAGLRVGEAWPNEATVEGVQVHYFIQPFSKLEQSVAGRDDDGLFIARNARPVHDGERRFAALRERAVEVTAGEIEAKVEEAHTFLRQRCHVVRLMLERRQPLIWIDTVVLAARAALQLCCWLDGEPRATWKWLLQYAARFTQAGLIVPGVEGLLQALGAALQAPHEQSPAGSPLLPAAEALRNAAADAVRAAGYEHLPLWLPTVERADQASQPWA